MELSASQCSQQTTSMIAHDFVLCLVQPSITLRAFAADIHHRFSIVAGQDNLALTLN